jgi:hypothetical protein
MDKLYSDMINDLHKVKAVRDYKFLKAFNTLASLGVEFAVSYDGNLYESESASKITTEIAKRIKAVIDEYLPETKIVEPVPTFVQPEEIVSSKVKGYPEGTTKVVTVPKVKKYTWHERLKQFDLESMLPGESRIVYLHEVNPTASVGNLQSGLTYIGDKLFGKGNTFTKQLPCKTGTYFVRRA